MFDIFEVHPFGSILVVAVSDTPNKLVTKLNIQNPGVNIDYPVDHIAACTYERMWKPKGARKIKQYIFVIIDSQYADPSTMAHEAVHVVNYIFDYVGLHLDSNNDEAQAYTTGHVVKLMDSVVKKFKTKTTKRGKTKNKA